MTLIVLHRALRFWHRPLILSRPAPHNRLGDVIEWKGIVLNCASPLIAGRARMVEIWQRHPTTSTTSAHESNSRANYA
jgi:hypothetical protein